MDHQTHCEMYQKEIDNLKAKNANLEAKVRRLREKNEDADWLQEQINGLIAEKSKLNIKITTLYTERDAFNAKISQAVFEKDIAVQQSILAKETEDSAIDELNKVSQKLQDEIQLHDCAQEKYADLCTEFTEIEMAFEKQSKMIEKHKADFQTELDAKEKALEEKEARIQGYAAKISERETEHTELQEAFGTLVAENKKQKMDLQAQLSEKDKALEDKEAKIQRFVAKAQLHSRLSVISNPKAPMKLSRPDEIRQINRTKQTSELRKCRTPNEDRIIQTSELRKCRTPNEDRRLRQREVRDTKQPFHLQQHYLPEISFISKVSPTKEDYNTQPSTPPTSEKKKKKKLLFCIPSPFSSKKK